MMTRGHMSASVNPAVSLLDELLDSQAAAALLGIHSKTLERAARRGEVPGYFRFRRWYFSKSELDAWLRVTVRSPRHVPAPHEQEIM